jgi:hypothetical protein
MAFAVIHIQNERRFEYMRHMGTLPYVKALRRKRYSACTVAESLVINNQLLQRHARNIQLFPSTSAQ